MLFHNRTDAGRQLASRLAEYADQANTLVLALPRGGVPVAFEVARALHASLDVLLVRKLSVPGHKELAMGAVASGGVRVINQLVVRRLGIAQPMIDAVATDEMHELARRERDYRGDRPVPEIRERTVILVDDGLATSSTMLAAVTTVRQQQPARLVVAVPIAAAETCAEFRDKTDETVCVHTPKPFYSVSSWYADFSPTSDQQVCQLLAYAAEQQAVQRQAVG